MFGIVTAMHGYLWQRPGSGGAENTSGIEDEIFSGWAVRALEEADANGWVKIETHYGYEGYMHGSQIRWITREELQARQEKQRYFRVGVAEADLLTIPKVQGLPLELLLKNAIVELLERESAEGWSRIRTAAGCEGYVHTKYLLGREEDDGYLLTSMAADPDRKAYFRKHFKQLRMEESALRSGVTKSALAYLGTQYRWGGKSSQGLDCSGLVFMSYLENGVLICRDARVLPDYPVRLIDRSAIQPGDLLFFPGHAAMYLGDGKYIHATARASAACVTVNSLKPQEEDYREDLDQNMTGCGSVFP